MYRIAVTVAALAAGCATTAPYGGGLSAQNVNCGAGVLGGALVGGVAGNQIGKGQGQDRHRRRGHDRRPARRDAPRVPAAGLRPATGGRDRYAQAPAPVLVGYDRYGRPIYR